MFVIRHPRSAIGSLPTYDDEISIVETPLQYIQHDNGILSIFVIMKIKDNLLIQRLGIKIKPKSIENRYRPITSLKTFTILNSSLNLTRKVILSCKLLRPSPWRGHRSYSLEYTTASFLRIPPISQLVC